MPRNPEIDRWFAARKHPLDAAMRRARDIILGADSRVTETIKWSTPTFAYEGNIVSFNPSKNVVSLMFHRGAEIPGRHPRLEGDGQLVRTMRFASLDEVEAGRKDIEAAVRAWCEWKGSMSKSAAGKEAASKVRTGRAAVPRRTASRTSSRRRNNAAGDAKPR